MILEVGLAFDLWSFGFFLAMGLLCFDGGVFLVVGLVTAVAVVLVLVVALGLGYWGGRGSLGL